ncbi:MAG: hypothetical protein CME63_15145 [Halobacteriovoraceae bacterium]|nr:hypothetical protein [Halobacteriovoraceae bacterium]|tara:strand:+ start:133529 stop:134188 length:660 start_codon:yes stop_codon:yes gene_type:complete
MHESLRYLLEKVLIKYSEKDFYDQLLEAKDFYFQRTGKVFEEDEDYESRMAAFNDWYVLEYRPSNADEQSPTFFEKYLSDHEALPEIIEAIKGTTHSLFEYTGTSFKGQHVLKDILHDEKIILAKTHPAPSLVKGDMFIGRIVKYLDEYYLYNGLRVMPNDAASILKKEAKKIRKAHKKNEEGRAQSEEKFLFLAESHKTKWQHYGHVNVEKIFVFPKS